MILINFVFMAGIADIIKRTIDLIENSFDDFASQIEKVEKSMLSAVSRILSQFDITDGNFSEENNTDRLVDLDELIEKSVNKSALKKSVDNYKVNFNEVDDLTKEFFEATLTKAEIGDLVQVFKNTRIKKAKVINDLDLYILNSDVLKANVLNEIRDEIFEAVIMRADVVELQNKLRKIIITEDGNDSKLLRYTKQISQDSLAGYQGALQDKVREQYNLDKVTYSGTIINTTRQFCYDFLLSKGRYAPYAIRRGVYRYEDLDAIITLATQCTDHHFRKKKDGSAYRDCGNGFKVDVTMPDNFSQYRGGFNCLHSCYYSRLTPRDLRIIEEKGIGDPQ